jgi:hypothetical protein
MFIESLVTPPGFVAPLMFFFFQPAPLRPV